MNLTRVDIRFRATGRTITSVTDEHLVASSDEVPWLPIADVITCSDTTQRAAAWARVFLARYLGCLVVAVRDADGGCVVGTRDGQFKKFGTDDSTTLGSIAHAWTVAGLRLDDLDGTSLHVVVRRTTPAHPTARGRVRPAARRGR